MYSTEYTNWDCQKLIFPWTDDTSTPTTQQLKEIMFKYNINILVL